MSLTFNTADAVEGHIEVTDRFGRLGSIWQITEAAVVEYGTEDDISAEDVGWYFDIAAPRLTTRSGGPYDSIQDVVNVVQEAYDEFETDWVQEKTFDYRQGRRVVSIPSGGQSRK